MNKRGWGSSDFNAPDEALCHSMMDRAILDGGVNLVALAESSKPHITPDHHCPRSKKVKRIWAFRETKKVKIKKGLFRMRCLFFEGSEWF